MLLEAAKEILKAAMGTLSLRHSTAGTLLALTQTILCQKKNFHTPKSSSPTWRKQLSIPFHSEDLRNNMVAKLKTFSVQSVPRSLNHFPNRLVRRLRDTQLPLGSHMRPKPLSQQRTSLALLRLPSINHQIFAVMRRGARRWLPANDSLWSRISKAITSL